MRNIKIDGVTYKAQNKKHVPYGVSEYVKELQDSRIYEAMHLHKYVKDLEEGVSEQVVMKKAFAALYESPKQLAHFVRAQKLDERLLTASLIFGIDYDELEALPHETVLTLITEAEKEVGSVTDFLGGLGINTDSSLNEMAKTLKK